MKKIYLVLIACVACIGLQAATYTVMISGFTYTNAALSVTVGDVITIQATTVHPLVQVDQATWTANGTTSLSGGWGVKTADYTFTVAAAGSTFYVCQAHAAGGMKGRIDAVNPAGLSEMANSLNSFGFFPNPATNQVKINFSLNSEATVSARLYNMLGQEVDVILPATNLVADNYTQKLEVSALPNGVYFIAMNVNDRRITRRLVISK
jgi:plastocyanin